MKLLIFIILTTTCLAFCNRKSKSRLENEINNHNNIQGKTIRLIPDDDTSWYNKRLKANSEKSLGLGTLENGYKDFQIRIWEISERDTGKLILFQKHDNIWSSEAFEFRFVKTNSYYRLDSIEGRRLSVGSPKSGWENFTDRIIQMGILDLPDFGNIPNYLVDTDENSIKVEIAMNNYYRVYEYLGPEKKQDQFIEAKKLIDIVEFARAQFSL